MSSYNVVYSSDYLAHHGIKGQKWGIRRYQDENGALTDAGKRRYYSQDGSQDFHQIDREFRDNKRNLKKAYKNELLSKNEYKESKKLNRYERRTNKATISGMGLVRSVGKDAIGSLAVNSVYEKFVKNTGHGDNKELIETVGKKTVKDVERNTTTYMGKVAVYNMLGYGLTGKKYTTRSDVFKYLNKEETVDMEEDNDK